MTEAQKKNSCDSSRQIIQLPVREDGKSQKDQKPSDHCRSIPERGKAQCQTCGKGALRIPHLPGFRGKQSVFHPGQAFFAVTASRFHQIQIVPQHQRCDQKAECQMPLIQINVKIPQAPVLIRGIADKRCVFGKCFQKIAGAQMLPQISEKSKGAAKKRTAPL